VPKLELPRWSKSPLFANAPQRQPQKRAYASAKPSRLTSGWYAPNNSADSELLVSLTNLRARSRTLVRDAAYAKRAKVVVMNNVIGTGIGMQAQVKNQRGTLMTSVNDAIEEAWCEWSRPENCHTGGKLHFADLERQAIGQIFEAGEIVIRKHYRPFGSSPIPLALEVVEPERIADDYQVSGAFQTMLRMGIEQDEFGRPLAVWLRRYHPAEFRSGVIPSDLLMRVPSEQLFHLYVCDRWPQSRGEPWLHAAARKLNDMDGYSARRRSPQPVVRRRTWRRSKAPRKRTGKTRPTTSRRALKSSQVSCRN
jgi:lambda family phage portal protein